MPEQDTQDVVNAVDQDVETPASPTEIKVANPTAEEMVELCKGVTANYNAEVDTRAVKFNFKKSKDKETGIEIIRHPVDLAIPYPSVEGILAIIQSQDPKELELLQEAMEVVVNTRARDLLYEDTSLTAATFPVGSLSWNAIANIPKTQRRGGGIPKEHWEAFAKDYIAIMPNATGKKLLAVTNMARILQNKLVQAKTNTPVLEMVVAQLAIYAENTADLAEYADCVEFLSEKATTLLNVTPAELLDNL